MSGRAVRVDESDDRSVAGESGSRAADPCVSGIRSQVVCPVHEGHGGSERSCRGGASPYGPG